MMAKQGVMEAKYARYPKPECAAYAYAKLTKRQWRPKTRSEYEGDRLQNPGEVVSVDQMVSPTPGLIAQITGKLTNKRYKYATIFMDQASHFGYVYLQKTATADETIEGKEAFEALLKTYGVNVRAYHADNGIFKANKWVAKCRESQQKLTFAGVNAHHQNGVAERRIRDLQDSARAMMMHSKQRWPNTVDTYLWPYAMKMASNILNMIVL